MAIVGGAINKYVERTANLPANNSWTVAMWLKRNSDRDNYEAFCLFRMFTTPATYSRAVGQVFPSWDTPTTGPAHSMAIRNDTGGGSAGYPTTLPGTGAWYYVAMSCGGTTHKAYWYTWNGSSYTLVDSTVLSISVGTLADPSDAIQVLADSLDSRYIDGKCCYVRVWDVELTQPEIQAELVSSVIVKTTGINTALGACTDSSFANDVSGNGRNWTLGAGLTTSDFDSDVPSGLSSGATTPINVLKSTQGIAFGSARMRHV